MNSNSGEYFIQRGEIYFVCLDPVFGREMGGFKMRPCVVVSIGAVNAMTRLVTVVPGTSSSHAHLRNRQHIVTVHPDKENQLTNQTSFEIHQIRAIERGRFTQRPSGRVSAAKLLEIERSIGFCLGLILEQRKT